MTTTPSTPESTPAKTPATPHKAASPAKKARSVKKAPVKTAKTVKVVKPVKTSKAAKPKKAKLVRDGFTIPKEEYAVIGTLKQRCSTLGQPARKSELLRAGIKLLNGLSDKALLAALKAVPALKTGRPKKA